jgi:hypothetical protein
MAWDALPLDVQDLILARIPLFELAQASAACRTFQERFKTRLAEEQKLRFDLADECFGQKRIDRIAAMAARFFKRENAFGKLDRGRTHVCHISAVGEWQVERRRPSRSANQHNLEAGDLHVRLSFMWGRPTVMEILVHVPGRALVKLHVCGGRGMIAITVTPYGDMVFEGLALVQALITWALPRRLRDYRSHANVMIQECAQRSQFFL